MLTEKQIQTERGETYTLVERLGRGAIATVWKAEGPDGQRAAVKIAHPALHPDLRRQFETEYETLRDRILSRAEAWPAGRDLPPTPAFIHKAGADALVLEWIEAPTLAAWVKDETDLAARQERLIEPARQYAWFLDFLHNRVGIGQSDRKLGDLYWDTERNRLVVLDWNVVAGVDRAPEDVYKFGEFWYALLLETPPIFGADLAGNPKWAELSIAWRDVLVACLHVNRQARPAAQSLLRDLAELQECFRQPAQALDQGREIVAAVRESRPIGEWERLKKAQWRLDLAWRKGLDEAHDLAAEVQVLLEVCARATWLEVEKNLRLGRYADALGLLDHLEAESGGRLSGRFQAARWRCLCNAGQASQREALAAVWQDQMPALILGLEALPVDLWRERRSSLFAALASFPTGSETRRILEDLAVEPELSAWVDSFVQECDALRQSQEGAGNRLSALESDLERARELLDRWWETRSRLQQEMAVQEQIQAQEVQEPAAKEDEKEAFSPDLKEDQGALPLAEPEAQAQRTTGAEEGGQQHPQASTPTKITRGAWVDKQKRSAVGSSLREQAKGSLVLSLEEGWREEHLAVGDLTLGGGEDNNIVVARPEIPQRFARINCLGNSCVLYVLEGAEDTLVSGLHFAGKRRPEKNRSFPLSLGDIVYFGGQEVFQLLEKDAEEAAAARQ